MNDEEIELLLEELRTGVSDDNHDYIKIDHTYHECHEVIEALRAENAILRKKLKYEDEDEGGK